MATYYVNEAVFTLPEKGFVDRTLHRLESPLGGEDPLGVEIRRLPMSRGKSLRQLVDDEIAATKAKVSGFTVTDDAEVALAGSGAPAIVVRARMRARDEVHHELQAHFAFNEMWIAFTVRGPSAERAACEATFDRMVQSLEWRNA